MAYALVANTGKAGTGASPVTTDAIDTTGANFLVVAIAKYSAFADAAVGHLTDSKTNTWNILTVRESAANTETVIYWSRPTSVGTAHTFTYDDGVGSDFPTICVAAFSGSVASPFDVENGNNGGNGSTIQPGSVTPSENDELIATSVGVGGAVTIDSIDSGFTITNTVNYVGSTNMGVSLAYKIQTTAAAENPTWTLSTATDRCAAIATFKAAGGGATSQSYYCSGGWF